MKNIEFEAKEKLMARLDGNLLDHAKQLAAGDGPSIVEVYRLQGLAEMHCFKNNLDYLCKALKNRHFRGYGQPNLLPIYYFWGKSLDMRSTARAERPERAAHR